MKETKFKMTEVGMIPQEWRSVKLEDYFDFGNGYTPSKAIPAFWENGTIPWFRMEDIRTNGHILKDSIQHVTPQAVKASGLFPKYSIILSTTATIGEHALLIADSLANQRFTFLLRKVNRIDEVDIMYFYWHCYALGDWCRKNINAGGLLAVNMEDLKEYPLPLPPLREQSRIASALSSIDSLLSSLDKLIAKKQAIKQGAMQQLLTGKKRLKGFKEEWVEKKLGEIGTFAKGRGISRAESSTGSLPAIRYGEIYTSHNDYIKEFYSFISTSVAEQSTRLKCGDILFAASGETKEDIAKAVAFVNPNVTAYAGGDIIILSPDRIQVDSKFMGFLLNTPSIIKQKASKAQGDAVVHITSHSIASIEVHLPSIPEQRTIASVLTSMDKELAALAAKKQKYGQIKQGMMQQLLTGKVRLT